MRKFHILSSVALAFSLFFTLGTTAMQAQDGSEFAGGNGTEENPWQIATKKQLAAFGNNYGGEAGKGKYFVLTKSLEFTAEDFSAFGDFYNNGNWKSLCEDGGFRGTFDGENHEVSISGLKSIKDYNHNATGFFYALNGATVKNLTISYGTINIDTARFGGIVHEAKSSIIDNCHVNGVFTGAGNVKDFGGIVCDYGNIYVIDSSFTGNIEITGGERCAGIAAFLEYWNYSGGTITVSGCFVDADISSGSTYTGGIIGGGGGSIQDCHVKGNMATNGSYLGGLVGTNMHGNGRKKLTIKNSSFEGILKCGTSKNGSYVGGLVGAMYANYSDEKLLISESYSKGEIRVDNGTAGLYDAISAGGLVGFGNHIDIADSYSHCNISITTKDPLAIGGLIGNPYGTANIFRSYAMGEIKGDQALQASISGNHAYVGGLLGCNNQQYISILKSVAMNPSLIAPHGDKEDTGRIIGITDDKCNLDNNYALDTMILKISNKDVSVTGTANDKNGQDKTAAELAQQSTYTGLDWDFDNIWKMSVNGYPIFIWQEDTPIEAAPIITGQPVSQTVNAGDSVTFSVTATGTEPLSYQWYKGSSQISGATSSSYTISSVTTSDAGSYYVIVSNSIGSATSSVATLTVNAPASAPVIVTQPVSQTVDVGQSVRFSVVAIGTEPLNYQWLKDGAAIPGATGSSYTISSAKMEDAGNYMVIVSNSVGMAVSNPVTLTVKDPAVPPVIIVQPMSQEVLIGESVTFSVVATGTEPLSYQWLFNGNPIPGATSSTYSISQVTEAHAGNYSVIVSNVAGTAISSTAVLTVKILPPVIVTHPQTQIIMRGSTATFAVIADGYGLSYQWTFNGKDIAGANQPVYMIPAAEAVNVGSYAVKVSNKAGSVTSQSAMLWLNNLQMYAGVEVYGPIGAKFTVWYKDDAESGEWKKLTSSTVSASPTVVIDYDSPQNKKRFYKVEIE